jgi:hypothetical protein
MKQILISNKKIVDSLLTNKKEFIEGYEALLEHWTVLNDKFQENYREWSVKFGQQKLEENEKEPCPPPKPVNRVKDYNFYLGYFQTDARLDSKNIPQKDKYQTLNENEYRKFILDQWQWTRDHFNTLEWYSTSGAAMMAEDISAYSISADKIGKAYRATDMKLSF